MTSHGSIGVIRHAHLILRPDASRVLFRPFRQDSLRELKIVARVMSLSEEEAKIRLTEVLSDFEERHQKGVFWVSSGWLGGLGPRWRAPVEGLNHPDSPLPPPCYEW